MRKILKHSKSIKITIIAGIISVVSFVFMMLALIDIYRGKEPDLSNEWLVVAIGVCVNIAFGFLAIFTAASLLTAKDNS